MRLESLANELLVGIYECLPDVRLLRAFCGLNEHFDIICQVNLLVITNPIISLALSDSNETIQLFRSGEIISDILF
jgi:hypothetical protein